jgi:glyceraldehyde 3-phosphate dehydrogenase
MENKTAQIAINGFGRIGRASFKIALEKGLNVVAINDIANPRVLAHLLKYDTAYGVYDKDVWLEEDGKIVRLEENDGGKEFFNIKGTENFIVVDGKKTAMFSDKDPANLPWGDLGVDVVLECTGKFTKDDAALVHISSGAKKVVVSAPVKGGTIQTFMMGVNDSQYLGQNAISNASCTTNCISPVLAIIDSNFKILKAGMSTIHAVTANQNVVDSPPFGEKVDMRRARAAGYNIVPTTTGAADATGDVLPNLKGKFDGTSLRVPIITGSIVDITALLEKNVTKEEVNKVFEGAAKDPKYMNVIKATYEPLVSSDIIGDPHSAIVDLSMTTVIDGNMLKIFAWYDNEWGYSCRLVDMAIMMVS